MATEQERSYTLLNTFLGQFNPFQNPITKTYLKIIFLSLSSISKWLISQKSVFISYHPHVGTHLQGLHGRADFAVAHLLIENITEAIAAAPILSRDDEAVELRLQGVFLRAKLHALRQA
jgi:hypothetical protein